MKILHIIFGIVTLGLVVTLIRALSAGSAGGLMAAIISLSVIGGIWLIVGIADYRIKHKNYADKDNNADNSDGKKE